MRDAEVKVAPSSRRLAIFRWSQTLAALGEAMLTVTAMVLLLPQGAGFLALALGARALGASLSLLPGGVIADRFPRLRIVTAGNCIRSVLAAGLILVASDTSIAIMIMISIGLADGLIRPSVAAAIADLAGERCGREFGRWHSQVLSAQLLGPALAAGMLVIFDIVAVQFVVVVAYLIAGASTFPVHRALDRVRDGGDESWFRSLAAGLRLVNQARWLRFVLLVDVVQCLLPVPAWLLLLAVLAPETWGEGTQGFVLSAFAIGGVLASRLMGVKDLKRPLVAAILAQGVIAVGLVALAFKPPLPVMILVGLVVGGGVRVGIVWFDVVIAEHTPSEFLGRVNSTVLVATAGAMPVGYAVVGAILPATSVMVTSLVAAGLSSVVTLLAACSGYVRRFPAEAAEPKIGFAQQISA